MKRIRARWNSRLGRICLFCVLVLLLWRHRPAAESSAPSLSATGPALHLDSDGDDLSNFAEYALDLSPVVADKDTVLSVDTTEVEGVNYLRYRFSRNRAASEVAFVLVHSPDLAGWQERRQTLPRPPPRIPRMNNRYE